MKNFQYTSVLVSILIGSLAQILLKQGTKYIGPLAFSFENIGSLLLRIFSQPLVVLGLALYGVSFVIWIFAISKLEISVAYPMLSVGFIVNAVAAYYLLGESMSLYKLLGIFFIILGTFLITYKSV